MAPATQQPPQPHESPLHLFLPLCGQPLHHPQRTFLHHPVTQTLINPDFFGDPVELEPANLPNHGKFRTLHLPAASAWPASRLELTPSTSTPTPGPASTATTAVHHLIDLYLAKGAAACRRFLRAKSPLQASAAMRHLVSVPHPVPEGSPPFSDITPACDTLILSHATKFAVPAP